MSRQPSPVWLFDECLTRVALRVQGVEVLLQPFFGRLPRVDPRSVGFATLACSIIAAFLL